MDQAALPDCDLASLEDIIRSELTYWMDYLNEVRDKERLSYANIISDSNTTSKTKIQALRYILETLPLRHKALVSAYNTESYELSCQLVTLLENLKDEEMQVELEGWYENKLVKNKKMTKDILAMDAEIEQLEDGRFGELKSLLGILENFKMMKEDGLVGNAEIEGLIAAMDSIGLSANGEGIAVPRRQDGVNRTASGSYGGKQGILSWMSNSS